MTGAPDRRFDWSALMKRVFAGMNFLSDFNFEIRPAELRILVEKIAP